MLSKNGVEQTIGFYLPGEIMGLDALQHGRYTCSAVALETAMICELPLTRIYDLAGELPGFQAQFIRIIGKELTSDQQKIALGHLMANEKIAAFLLMLSQRYRVLGYSNTVFNLTMCRKDIANFLGLSCETLSRQMTQLSGTGIINITRRNIQINDLEALKGIVQHHFDIF